MTRLMTMATIALMVALHAQPHAVQAQETTTKSAPAASAPAPVNLNSATAAQLETLPGIGAATAMRIIEYRTKNGGFKKIEDLMNVRGVGEKSFLKLKPLVTVSAPRADRSQ